MQTLLSQLQVFRQLPRAPQVSSSTSSSSSHGHRRGHQQHQQFARQRPSAPASANTPRCGESFERVLSGLEKSGTLATMIR